MMSLCLNMIVRDEAAVIGETLANLLDHLTLDYWVIHDTGSQDATPQIIENFFAERGIAGQLFHRAWENFGANRQYALQDARGHGDYVLFFDADSRFEGKLPPLPAGYDAFMLNTRRGNTLYPIKSIVRNDGFYRWRGVVHEGLYPTAPRPERILHLQGNYALLNQSAGARSRDASTYYRDARLLVKALESLAPEDRDLLPRYTFYCANSWRDAQVPREAIHWYRKRIALGGWADEVYCSWLGLGIEMVKLADHEGAMLAFLAGQEVCPERAECFYQLARLLRLQGKPHMALLFAKEGRARPQPGADRLFVWRDVYAYWLDYEWLLSLQKLGRLAEGAEVLARLRKSGAPAHLWQGFAI